MQARRTTIISLSQVQCTFLAGKGMRQANRPRKAELLQAKKCIAPDSSTIHDNCRTNPQTVLRFCKFSSMLFVMHSTNAGPNLGSAVATPRTAKPVILQPDGKHAIR